MILQLKESDYTEPNYRGLFRPQAKDDSALYLLGSLLLIGGLLYYKAQQNKEKKPAENVTSDPALVQGLNSVGATIVNNK